MDMTLRDHFITLWQKYFPGAELPLALEFRAGNGTVKKVPPPGGWRCIICQIGRARSGTPLAFDSHSVTCSGGRMYTGIPASARRTSGTSSRTGTRGLWKGSGTSRHRRLSMHGRT